MPQDLWKCLYLLKDMMVFSFLDALWETVFEDPPGQLFTETAEATLVAFLSLASLTGHDLQHPEGEYSLKDWA